MSQSGPARQNEKVTYRACHSSRTSEGGGWKGVSPGDRSLNSFKAAPSKGMRNSDSRVAKAPRKIEAQDMAKTNQRAQRLISVSQSRFESEAGPRLSARPTSIQSESRLLWADFSKQRKQNKSGTFNRCKAARNHLLPLLAPVTPFPFPPDQSQNKADPRFHPLAWKREEGVAQ